MKIMHKSKSIKKKLQYEYKQPYNRKALKWSIVFFVIFYISIVYALVYVGGTDRVSTGSTTMTYDEVWQVNSETFYFDIAIYIFFFLFLRAYYKPDYPEELDNQEADTTEKEKNENLKNKESDRDNI